MTSKKTHNRKEQNSPMLAETRRVEFARALLAWYDANARDLPWRGGHDPYRIWISEIMLQQTRVAAVLEHYRLFLKEFPNLRKLAAAREGSVLAAWSGLGYYRRARMLHAAAKLVVKEHAGRFPESSEGLRRLPGIGRYTAAAIASIAFGEAVPVVDGNVERVLERLEGKRLAGEAVWQAATAMLDPKRPGDFNQSMMELGAMVCVPREPRCPLCPVAGFCATRGELKSRVEVAPQKKRAIQLGLARRHGQVFIVQRKQHESLMPGMWELPECADGFAGKTLLSLRHSITVTDYTVRVVEMPAPVGMDGEWISASRLGSLPLTGLARKILRRVEMI